MADDDSFMKSLFHGVIAENVLFPWPEPSEGEADSVAATCESVRRFFAANVDSAKIDATCEIPAEVLSGLKAMGLFGAQIPAAYGGAGLSATAYARVMQEVASLDPAIAVTLGGHQSIGLKGLLLFGTDDQKQRYLPRLATGEHVAAFALTEPGAGSDAAAIQTRADKQPDGSYALSGSK